MNRIVQIIIVLVLAGCKNSDKQHQSIELIGDVARQDSIFQKLLVVANNTIVGSIQHDSLAFLVLPVQASCPACRKKTIDSIMKHRSNLPDRHFIIISARGGHKTINSFFKEQDYELPVMENKLFLDSINLAFKYDLYDTKPTIYYTFNGKAYKKVAAIPTTVRQDLQEFFTGWRNDSQIARKNSKK